MKTITFLKIYLITFSVLLSTLAQSEIITDTLYINSGYYQSSVIDSFPYLSFNEDSSVFTAQNSFLNVGSNDTLVLYISNRDSVGHNIVIDNSSFSMFVQSQQYNVDSVFGLTEGLYILKCTGNYSDIGFSTILKVEDQAKTNFYWNLKDFNDSLNVEIRNGNSIDESIYDPNFFLVNGKPKSLLDNDSLALIKGSVGDTLLINIVNTGLSYHSLHFHGYHCEIVYSGLHPNHIGREKDTFLLEPEERYILRLIPDKPGIYPVHDHNLVAVTGGGIYPNGIFVIMNINN